MNLKNARGAPPGESAAAVPTVALAPLFANLPKTVLGKLAKLGIRAPFDLVLHLPLRYEDETHLCAIRDLPFNESAQTEGEIIHAEIQYRPRRQLVCQLADGGAVLHLRFLNFYPSQVKQLQPGMRLRVLGDLRQGYYGPEMVHPRYRVVRADTPLKDALTPVYPTTTGLAQHALRQLIEQALGRCDLSDPLPPSLIAKLRLPAFGDSVKLLRWKSAPCRLGAGSSSTSCWRSSFRCASPTASGARTLLPHSKVQVISASASSQACRSSSRLRSSAPRAK
jgi:RecG-like helicase